MSDERQENNSISRPFFPVSRLKLVNALFLTCSCFTDSANRYVVAVLNRRKQLRDVVQQCRATSLHQEDETDA